MCRSIAEAGDSTRRRCPIHRRDAVVAIHLAATESGLPQNVVEDLFTELRREGRHVSVSGLGGDNYSEVVTRIEEQFTDETPQRYRDILNERNTDAPITSDTLFALARIRGAAISRAGAVQERVERVARRSPRRSPAQVQSEYESLRREVDAGDPRYTPEAVAEAQENNLPTDIVSVVAFQNLQARIEAENAENAGPSRFDVEDRAIERVSLRRTGSPFSEGAYDFDGGVLELTFNQGTIYRYQNVPEEVWEELRESEEAGRYFHDHIRGNSTYQYSNVTEAQEATSTVHCEGCGQFVPLDGSHVCPAREDVIVEHEQVAVETEESETEESAGDSERVVPTREEVLEAWRAPQESLSGTLHGRQISMTYFGGRSRYDLDASDENIETYEASRRACRTLSLPDEENTVYQCVPARYWNEYEGTDVQVPERSTVYIPVRRNEPGGRIINLYGSSPTIPLTEYTGDEIVVVSEATHTFNSYNMAIRRNYQAYGPHYLDDIPVDRRRAHIQTYSNARFNDIDINSVDPDLRASAEAAVAERLRESDMTIGERRASAVRVEASLPGVLRMRHNWVNVATARKLNTGEEVGGRIKMGVYLDRSPEGYYLGTGDGEISGFVSMKRDENGKLQITSSERSLQCNCSIYATRYRCEHVRRAYKDILVTAIEEYAGERAAAQPRDPNAIPASLTRFDPNVTAVRREGRGGRRFTEMTFSSLARSPRRMTIEATREELLADQERLFDHMFLRNSQVYAPRAHLLSTSLNNSDRVEFPIQVDGDRRISGSLTMSNTSDGSIAVDTSRLRCSCGRFTSTQTACQHIETIGRTASTVLLDRGFTDRNYYYLPSDRFGYGADFDVERAYRDEVAIQEMVDALISDPNTGFTVQDLHDPEEIVAAARVRQEEFLAEQRRVQEVARAERERLEAEYERQQIDRATRDRLIREGDFYRQNPGLREEHESYRELARQRWEGAEPSQFDSIATIGEKIENYKSQGARALPTKTEGVTFGICDPNVPGSRRFGIELEFDLPRGWGKSEKLAEIARQLYQAGLTSSPRQEGYHSGARNGYQKWSFERDATVDGEMVSPILDDSPESWEQVQKVLDIIKANGGRASARAGSHVHVSSSSYVDSSAKKAEMIRLVQEHEAVIYRAAANPSTGTHRGTNWCGPNPEVRGVILEREHTRIGHSSHTYGVNLESANNMTRGANVEVRMWDSTLDLAAIQQQVAVSAALVDRAEYNVERDGESTPRDPSENLGMRSSFTEERGHAGIKKFLEDLIPTQAGRENALRLISLNRWNR